MTSAMLRPARAPGQWPDPQLGHHSLTCPPTAHLHLAVISIARKAMPRFTPLRLDHESFAESCPLALPGSAFYPVLVHRLAVSLHASSPRSVALPQLRFTSFAVASSRGDFHPQDCARAGRTHKKPRTGPGLRGVQSVFRPRGRPARRKPWARYHQDGNRP